MSKLTLYEVELKKNELMKLREHYKGMTYDLRKLSEKINTLNNQINSFDKIVIPFEIEKLKKIINEFHAIDIDTKCRKHEYKIARMQYYAILRTSTHWSLKKICSTLRLNQDHATLINSLNNHTDFMDTDKYYFHQFCELVSKINDINPNQNEDLQNMSESV